RRTIPQVKHGTSSETNRKREGPGCPRPFAYSALLSRTLLELDARAGFLELRLDRVGLLLVHALLDRRRGAVDEVLGLLEAEAGDRAHDLDHLDLLLTCSGEDDVEGGLLLHRSAVAACGSATRGRHGDGRSSRDAPLVLD